EYGVVELRARFAHAVLVDDGVLGHAESLGEPRAQRLGLDGLPSAFRSPGLHDAASARQLVTWPERFGPVEEGERGAEQDSRSPVALGPRQRRAQDADLEATLAHHADRRPAGGRRAHAIAPGGER